MRFSWGIDNGPTRAKLSVNMVTTLLLAGILVALVAAGVYACLVLARLQKKLRSFEDTVRVFFTAPNDKTPSPFAVTVDECSQLVSRALIAQAKATFMGEASAASRMASRAEGQAAQAALMGKFPWLAAIAGLAPGFSKSLLKNPALAAGIGQILNRGPGAGAAVPTSGPPASGNGHESPANLPLRLDLGGH